MPQIDIIGTGNMGQAIAGLVTKGGNSVELFDRTDDSKPITGEVVVLAVPYAAVAEIITARRQELAGKVVIDITNPVNFETFDGLTVAPDSSATADIVAGLPQSRVVEAFNTNFAATLTAGSIGSEPVTVLVAGDDGDAKALVAGLVTAAGMRAIDAGGLKRARELEALGFLQISLAATERISWTSGFVLLP